MRRFPSLHNEQKSYKILPRRSVLKAACSGGVLTTLAGCGMFEDDPDKPTLYGRRSDVLSTGAGLRVNQDNKTPITLPPVQDVKQWCQDGRTPSHEAVNARWARGKQAWSHSIGAAVDPISFLALIAIVPNQHGALQSPPVVGNQRIFTTDAQGHVKAWSWPQLKLQWHYQPARHTRSTNIGGGTALVGDTLYIVDGVSQACAVDAATGRQKWSVKLLTPGRSAPTISDGLMVFTTIDERLYALDTKTGRQKWTYQATEVSTSILGQAAPAIVGNIVLAGFGSGDLVALRATSGEVVWSDSLGGGNGMGAMLDFACVRGAPVVVDGTAYAVSMSRVLVAIDMRSGRRLWEREASSQNPLCACGNWLYVVSLDQQVACLDRITGQVRWVTQLRRFEEKKAQKGTVQWVGPLLVNNKLVCFSSLPEEGMAIIDAITGKIEETSSIPASCQVQPIVCDGKVMALTQDGVLRAYG